MQFYHISYKLSDFLTFILSSGEYCEGYINCQDIEHQLQENITFIIIVFMKLSIKSEISSTHLKSFTANFCDIAHPYKLFTSQYLFLS